MKINYTKGTVVRHPSKDWGLGVILEDSVGALVKVGFEKVGVKNLSLEYVDLDLVAEYSDESKRKIVIRSALERVYVNEPFSHIYADLKSKLPHHLVIIENGVYFEVLEKDAEYFRKAYGWKIYERELGVSLTGFPTESKRVFNDLKLSQQPYLIVRQITHGSDERAIQRKVGYVYP